MLLPSPASHQPSNTLASVSHVSLILNPTYLTKPPRHKFFRLPNLNLPFSTPCTTTTLAYVSTSNTLPYTRPSKSHPFTTPKPHLPSLNPLSIFQNRPILLPTMPPAKLLDTHIHLWPTSAATPQAHAWMSPGHFLAKRHSTSDYLSITSPRPAGFVYVETDRRLAGAAPSLDEKASDEEVRRVLRVWAGEPLEEVRFLRGVCEGRADGVGEGEGKRMKGVVLWAPFNLPCSIFDVYLAMAEEVAGPELWERVVGFRYLLQGKPDGEVSALVSSESWVRNIVGLGKGRGGKGWCFDVGVDTHRDGDAGLEAVGKMVREVRRREGAADSQGSVRFVLNHLCKPNLSQSPTSRWRSALEQLSHDENVFMKLSGAFNEFDSDTPGTPDQIIKATTPHLTTIFSSFPQRIMFGSDWPVCNVGGPKGESGNWRFWVDVVEGILESRGSGLEEREDVWFRAGERAYGVDL